MKKRVYKIIDPHVHFFDLEKGEYAWLKSDAPPFWENKHLIAKNFGPESLVLNEQIQLAGFVHIEAGFNNHKPEAELAWLNSINSECKAIACADLTLPRSDYLSNLQACAQFPSFKGVRHILDENVNTILSHNNVLANLAEMNARSGLPVNLLSNTQSNTQSYTSSDVFECQIDANSETSFDLLHQCIEQTPNIKWILNHAGKPDLSFNIYGCLWQQNMREFAKHKNVYIKCSGLEMASSSYQYQDLAKFIAILVSIFPQERIMCASNFPLVLFRCSYVEYWQMIITACKEIDANTNMLVYSNALRIYGFD